MQLPLIAASLARTAPAPNNAAHDAHALAPELCFERATGKVRLALGRVPAPLHSRQSRCGLAVDARWNRRDGYNRLFTTKPTGSATSLGLSTSYDIVTPGPGRTLTFEDTAGGGVAFAVRQPAPPHLSTTTDTTLASTLPPEP